jgi:hypothetical protein
MVRTVPTQPTLPESLGVVSAALDALSLVAHGRCEGPRPAPLSEADEIR